MKKLILLCLFISGAFAQETSLTAELTSRNAFLGDPVPLTITVTHPKDWAVAPLELDDELGDGRVLNQQIAQPTPLEGTDLNRTLVTVTLAWYRLDSFKVPPINVNLTNGTDQQVLQTPELSIDIVNMLTEEDQALAPPKGQVAMDVPSLIPWILGGLALLTLIALIIYRYFVKGKTEQQKPPPPPKPPYEEAIAALNALTSGSLLKEGLVKQFHVEITLIVRHYYGRLYGIPAEEMTSFELEDWMAEQGALPDGLIDLHRAFQEQCDRVKFAKHDPVEAENKETTNRAYQIIELLKPKVEGVANVATS